MSEVSFDSDAGDICLDFANTNNWHASDHPEENIHNYLDLVAWGKQLGLLSPESARELSERAEEQPKEANRAYNYAIQVREAIYRIFSHRYAGKSIQKGDLDILNSAVAFALSHQKLTPAGDRLQWEWKSEHHGTNLVAWKVALAAAELLTSDKVRLVRECEDDRGCGYLFIDMSKNHSRRWCSMESCGNRAKARRHYSRSKKE